MPNRLKIIIIVILFVFAIPNDMSAPFSILKNIDLNFAANAEMKAADAYSINLPMIDSDQDSISDDIEIDNGTDPHDPLSH